MNEKNLVICDRDIRYANSLAENISSRKELAVKVYVCSNLEKAVSLFRNRQIHLFLVDETYNYEERSSLCARQTFVLTGDGVQDLGEEESEVFKYQHANAIIREVFECYLEKNQGNVTRMVRKAKPKLLAVYSPIHRCGKTRFAIALGEAFAQKEKTLYLNLEEYGGSEEEEESLDLGDLLYYMKQGNANLGIRLPAAVRKREELDYVLPVPLPTDLKEISFQEWEMFLSQLEQYSEYETIILDMGDSLQGLFRLLQRCDRIYMPILEDDTSRQKLRRYQQTVQTLQLAELKQKTSIFALPEQVEEYARLRAKEEW